MATLAQPAPSQPRRRSEAQSFFLLALLMAASIVAGFSLNLLMGRSSFGSPLVVHVHAFTYFGWLAVTLVQIRFAAAGPLRLHRKLGWISVVYVPVLLVMGFLIMRHSFHTAGGPFFFAQNEFLWGNLSMLGCFAVLITWAILRRRDTATHSRLMLCALAILTGPGLGRILPAPLLIPWAWQVSILVTLIWPVIGMVLDLRRHGAVHRIWFKAVALILGVHILSQALAYTPLGIDATRAFVAGTPGAERPMAAFLPPGFAM